MELAEKIETNVVAWLASLTTWPSYFDTALIRPGESAGVKTAQLVQVLCGDADLEDPPFSGNFWQPVEIQVRTPMGVLTASEAGDADPAVATAPLAKHQAVAGAVWNALLATDLVAQINAAAQAGAGELKNFALIGFTDRKPIREQGENYWMSGIALRLLANGNAAAA